MPGIIVNGQDVIDNHWADNVHLNSNDTLHVKNTDVGVTRSVRPNLEVNPRLR